jgi:hypothetical protein
MTKTIAKVLDLIEAEQANGRMKEIDPLTFLKGIYMNDELPLSVRMRAAVEVLPFIHPKLAVTAQVTENDLAVLLDRRIKKFQEMKLIEHAPQAVEVKSPLPRVPDRRYRRI